MAIAVASSLPLGNHSLMLLILYVLCMPYYYVLKIDMILIVAKLLNLWNTHLDFHVLEQTHFGFLHNYNAKCLLYVYVIFVVDKRPMCKLPDCNGYF